MRRALISHTLIFRTYFRFYLVLACLLSTIIFLPSVALAQTTPSLTVAFNPATVVAGQPVTVTVSGSAIAANASVNVTAYLGATQIYSGSPTATVAGSVTFTLTPITTGTLLVNASVTLNSAGAATGQGSTTVTNYSLTPDTTSLSVVAGGSVSTNIKVNAINGFADNVTLSAVVTNPNNHNQPVSGVIIGFSSNPVAPNASSAMTITIPGTAPAGAYTVTVTGTDGTATRTTTLSLAGVDPDYQLSIDPALVQNPPFLGTGQTQTVTVTVTPLNGYRGVVNLSMAGATSVSGVSASLPNPPPVTLPPPPVPVTLDGTTSQTTTVTLTASASAVAGAQPTFTVVGLSADGNMSRSVDVKVNVVAVGVAISILTPTYTVIHVNTANTDRSIYVGDTVIDTFPTILTATGTVNGQPCLATATNYVWSIKSVAYSQDGVNFSPDSYLPSISGDPTNGGASGILTAKFPSDNNNHPPGFWAIVVRVHVNYTSNSGNGSGEADSLPNGFSVGKGDFDISATMDSTNSTIPMGGSGTASLTLTPLAGFFGTVNLSLLGAPAGMTGDVFPITLNADNNPAVAQRGYNINVTESTKPGTYPVNINGSAGILNHGAGVTVTVPARYAEITSPPYDPHNNSKIIPNSRTSNGSISVDVAATWISVPPGGGWYGHASMNTQNEQGFISIKTYQWLPIYGGQNADTSGHTYGGENGNSFWLDDLLTGTLAPTAGGVSVLGKSSSVGVAITNFGGTLPYNTAYTIHWHYPFENWSKATPIAAQIGYEMYLMSDSIVANSGSTCTVRRPNSEVDFSGLAFNAGSAALSGASTEIGAIGTVALDLTAPQVGAISTFLAVAGFEVSTQIPASLPDMPVDTSYDGDPETSFDAALRQQRGLNNNPPSSSYIDSVGNARPINYPTANRIDKTIAGQINSSNEYNYYSGRYGNVTVTAQAGRPKLSQTFNGDKYGNNGYIGSTTETVNYLGTYFYVTYWTISGIVPNPNG